MAKAVYRAQCKDERCGGSFYLDKVEDEKILCPRCGLQARVIDGSFKYFLSIDRKKRKKK